MTLSKLTDFGDWLSPIIVKELRQGLRTRVFTAAFIVLQGFMALFMLTGLNQRQDDSAWAFWFLVSITLLLVMPLRGFGALSSEIRLNTMDLISLTRLSAWRITAGKWAALVSQSFLLTVAVLPYVVIRYFFGGINVVAELMILAAVLILSCLLSALMVGLSAFPNFLIRSLLALGVSITVASSIMVIRTAFAFSSAGLTAGLATDGWTYFGAFVTALYLMFYFLDMGATRIAPEAVNLSTRKRTSSILFLIGFLGLPVLFAPPSEEIYSFAMAFVGLFALDALTERPSEVRSLHRPFVRRGLLGQIAQFLFTPGWLTAVFYVCILGAILFTGGVYYEVFPNRTLVEELTFYVSLVSSLLFPLLIIHLFFPDQKDLFATYFFVQLASVAAGTAIFSGTHSFQFHSMMWAGCPLPFVCFSHVFRGGRTAWSSAPDFGADHIFHYDRCVPMEGRAVHCPDAGVSEGNRRWSQPIE